MNTLQLIKEHFPEIQVRDRKKFVRPLEIQSRLENRDIVELIKEQRVIFFKAKEEAMPFLLHKIIATALLIETNDELEGTPLENYHCQITSNIGKRFMNAQLKIYQNEYNALAKDQTLNTNHMISQLEGVTKIMAHALKHNQDDVIDVCGLMQKDEVFAKRIQGIYKQHLKQIA